MDLISQVSAGPLVKSELGATDSEKDAPSSFFPSNSEGQKLDNEAKQVFGKAKAAGGNKGINVAVVAGNEGHRVEVEDPVEETKVKINKFKVGALPAPDATSAEGEPQIEVFDKKSEGDAMVVTPRDARVLVADEGSGEEDTVSGGIGTEHEDDPVPDVSQFGILGSNVASNLSCLHPTFDGVEFGISTSSPGDGLKQVGKKCDIAVHAPKESHLDEVVVLPPFCGFEGNSGLCFVGCCCLAFVGVDGSSSKPGFAIVVIIKVVFLKLSYQISGVVIGVLEKISLLLRFGLSGLHVCAFDVGGKFTAYFGWDTAGLFCGPGEAPAVQD
ncbi:hypothetical protein U1Q18_014528 [Sarracenia purpurea var. burkii]